MKNRILQMLALSTALFLMTAGLTERYHPVSLDREQALLIDVEIKGEVNHPGVYTLKNGADLQDLVDAAGGLSEEGDLSDQSLMRRLEEREVVVIGKKAADPAEQKISINTADEEMLQQLPGIGPAMAKRIIEYRSTSSFQSLEQLMEVKGIGEKMFEKIREKICL